MSRWGDERAVTVQIGAVLLLAILITALSLYQVNSVPDQNHGVEFTHNEQLKGELIELRDAIRNAGTETTDRGVPLTLGTHYTARVVAINPPNPSGTIRTSAPRNVTIGNASVDDEALQSILEEPPQTRSLTYEPRYAEYDGPTTTLEHSLLYDAYGDANVTVEEQTVFGEDSVTLVFLDGDLSRSAVGTVSVDVETIAGPTDETTLESDGTGNVTVTLPTNAPDRWVDSIGTTFDDEQPNARVLETDSQSVTVELADRDSGYDLRLAQVSVGTEPDRDDRFDDASQSDDGSSPGGENGTNAFDVDWRDESVTVEEGETTTLEVAVTDSETGDAVADAPVSFSRQGNGVASFDGEAETRTDESGTARIDLHGETAGETRVYASVAGETVQVPVTVVEDDPSDDPPGSGPDTVEVSDLVANQNGQSQTITVRLDGSLEPGDQVTIDLSDPHQPTGNAIDLDYGAETATVRSGSGNIAQFTTNPNTANVVYESNGDDAETEIEIELDGVAVGDVANQDFDVGVSVGDLERTATFVVKTDGDVTVSQQSTVDGNVYATGTVELEFQATVDGTVQSDEGIVVRTSAEIGGDVLSGGPTELEYRATVDGTVWSDDRVVVDGSAEIGGDVFSGGSVELNFQSRVGGEIVAADEVSFGGNEVEIDGPVTARGDVTLSYQSTIRGDVETDGQVILAQASEITGDAYVSSGNDIQCGGQSQIGGQPCSAYVDEHY